MRRKVLKALGGFAVALIVIGLFTWFVGWQEILSTASRASPPLLLLGSVIAFIGFLAVGAAWWVVVRRVAPYSLLEGLWVFLATQFANSVTPFGQLGGEPFIAYMVSRDSDIPIGESFGAVLAAGAFLALWRYKEESLALLERLGGWLSRGMDQLNVTDGKAAEVDGEYMKEKGEDFYAAFETLVQDRPTVLKALTVAHIAALLGVVAMHLFILSLGVDAPFSAILFLLPASMLAGYLPLPGGLGGVELAMTVLLNTVAQVPLPVASAAALFYRLATYWFGMLFLGGISASRLSVDVFSA